MLSVEATAVRWVAAAKAWVLELDAMEAELAELAAHVNAATARWLG